MAYYVPASPELASLTQDLQATFVVTDDDEVLAIARANRKQILEEISLEIFTIPGWLIDRWKFEGSVSNE